MAESHKKQSPYDMKSVEVCLQNCLQFATPRSPIQKSILEALGFHVSSTVFAVSDVPNVRTSIMDGYALSAQRSDCNCTKFQVIGSVFAGDSFNFPSNATDKALYVTTGSAIPKGFDAVVPIEQCNVTKDGSLQFVEVEEIPNAGSWVRHPGSDMKAGMEVIAKGVRITPREIGILSVAGIDKIDVFQKPTVGILSTGNELVNASAVPAQGQTRDCNRPMLQASLMELGANVIDYGIIGDTAEAMTNILPKASAECDILITTGSASMGDADFLKTVLEKAGTIHFGRMRMKPGKPTTFATVKKADGTDLLVFGLPGNPVSCFVTFQLLVEPTIQNMCGGHTRNPIVNAQLAQPLNLDPVRPEYHRASLAWCGTHFSAESTGMQRSSRILSLKDADCLLHLPRQAGTLPKGTAVQATVLNPLQTRGNIAEKPIDSTEMLEAAAFRSLVEYLQERTDVQNIDLMNLAGFCRNCLSKWYLNAAQAFGMNMDIAEAKKRVYGMDYKLWKKKYQTPATKEQLEAMKKSHSHSAPRHAKTCCPKVDENAPPFDFSVGVLTVSTRAANGIYEDKSGPEVVHQVQKFCKEIPSLTLKSCGTSVVPDDAGKISDAINELVASGVSLILTSGGTGFTSDDVTPEVTKSLLTKEAPSIVQAIQMHVLPTQPLACLSRGVCGVIQDSMILNLPGRPNAVEEILPFVMPILVEALRSMDSKHSSKL